MIETKNLTAGNARKITQEYKDSYKNLDFMLNTVLKGILEKANNGEDTYSININVREYGVDTIRKLNSKLIELGYTVDVFKEYDDYYRTYKFTGKIDIRW